MPKKKLGEEINNSNSVPPRVAKEVFDNGGMCDDDFLVEYYSGLLASSRTGIDRDDRVISLLSLLKTMSTYQIRTHYIIYTIFRSLFLGREINIQIAVNAEKLVTFIPIDVYIKAMDFNDFEDIGGIISHCIHLISLNNLISNNFYFGTKEFLLEQYPNNLNIKGEGFIVAPSPIGSELFLSIHGLRDCGASDIFSNKYSQLETRVSDIIINEGSVALITE